MPGLITWPQYSGVFVNVGIEQLRKALATFTAERGLTKNYTPRNVLMSLVEEVGELSELFQWTGEVSPDLPGFMAADKHRLAQELSEVLLYLIRLADVCEVDLGRAVLEKLTHNAAKYPKQQPQPQHSSNRCITTGLFSQYPKQQEGRPHKAFSSQEQQSHATAGNHNSRQGGSHSSNTCSNVSLSAAQYICNLPAACRQQQQQQQQQQQPTVSIVSPGMNLGEGINTSGTARAPGPEAVAPSLTGCSLAATFMDRATGVTSQQLPQQQTPQQQAKQQTEQQTGNAVSIHDKTATAAVDALQLPTVTIPLSAVLSPLVSPAAVAALMQQQQQGLLSTPISTVSVLVSDLQSTTSFSKEAAELLPQGLLDEIGHRHGHVSNDASKVAGTDGVNRRGRNLCASSHEGKISSDGIVALTSSDPIFPNDATSTSASIAGQPSNGGSRSSCAGSSDSGIAAAAASVAANSSATASVSITAAMVGREGASSSTSTSSLLRSLTSCRRNLTSHQHSSMTSCCTCHHSWKCSAAPTAVDEESKVNGEVSRVVTRTAAAVAVGNSLAASTAPGVRSVSFKQYAPPVVSTSSRLTGLSLDFSSPQRQPQQQPCNSNIRRVGNVPVVSLAAAVAAAAAAAAAAAGTTATSSAAAVEPVQHLPASPPIVGNRVCGLPYQQQSSPAGLLPPPLLGAYRVCSRCGGAHIGKCPAKAKCLRCFRKAHLGDCWSRCVSCNLVHGPGKCRAATSAIRDSDSSRDQQQQQSVSSPDAASAH